MKVMFQNQKILTAVLAFWKVLLTFLFIFFFCFAPAQKLVGFDTLEIKDASDFFADDYGSIYLYKKKDFSFTKYDSLGRQQGKMLLTLPYKIQDVQNPLNIVLFSENAQEIKFIDHNLNEIQKLDLSTFGFIKSAYAENLQQVWLLDESMKRLLQYNFRNHRIINSFPFFINTESVKDMLVFDNKVYILTDQKFVVYNFNAEMMFEIKIQNPRKLRRENEDLLIICKTEIVKFVPSETVFEVFRVKDSQIVDKNSRSYFELKDGKLYLYKLDLKGEKAF